MRTKSIGIGVIVLASSIGILWWVLSQRAKWQVGDSAYYYEEGRGWVRFTIIDIVKLDGTLSYLVDARGTRYWTPVKEFDKKLFSEAPIG